MAVEPEDIEELALAPKKVKTDEGEVEERYVSDILKGVNHAAAAEGQAAGPPFGMRIARTIAPNSRGRQ